MNIGLKLKKIRNLHNLSQAQLSEKIKVHTTNIARYETNKQTPTIEILKKIADFYDITIDYFISDNEEIKPASRIKDKKLLERFEAVESLKEEDKKTVIDLIDAFIAREKIKDFINKK